MTLPIAGQIYERDGKRRLVIQVVDAKVVWWIRPYGSRAEWACPMHRWRRWASKATIVQEAAK